MPDDRQQLDESADEVARPDAQDLGEADRGAAAPEAEEEAAARALGAEAAATPELAAELDGLRDRHLRLAAEYENFRKRSARERLELRSRAQGDLAASLLDALDDLGRVAHLDPDGTSARDVIAGVELVERKLLKQLEAAGLEQVAEVDGPFDPNHHEAISTVPAAAPEQDHTVAAVFQVGYRFAGQLLRPARVQVRVWSGAADAEESDEA